MTATVAVDSEGLVARRKKTVYDWKFVLLVVGSAAFVGVLWYILAAARVLDRLILPTPAAVWQAGRETWDNVLTQVGTTLLELVVALLIAWVGGLAIALTLVSTKALRPLLGTLRSIYAVPHVIIYPLMTLWFGFGTESKVIFGAFVGMIFMALMSASALMAVDQSMVRLFRSVGASRTLTIRKGILPGCLPGIFAGIRLSASITYICVVLGEMLASTGGIGYYITNAAALFITPQIYVGVITVLTLIGGLHVLITIVERSLLRHNGVNP
ncbi:ABC transporter permease subunit [Dactylosporangium sp. NPDC051485]|uniref:ABC transporter permease n=1 Tax=Dactylosporangium sp. NPDC051485 TaxID=3154846 RepID=UPI00343CADED